MKDSPYSKNRRYVKKAIVLIFPKPKSEFKKLSSKLFGINLIIGHFS
jgi:hypothetical protein